MIEILITIGILGILASIVIFAINPARQFAQARNAQRASNVNTILNAVYQYAVDNQGNLPTSLTESPTEICQTGAVSCTGLINLSVLTASERYLVSMPLDPSCSAECATNGVGYTAAVNSNGRVTVSAPDAELSATISVTR